MKKLLTLPAALFLLLTTVAAQAQVGIGTNTPHSSAALDISSTNKGLLPPRIALTSASDLTTIPGAASGLLVYNTAAAGSGGTSVTPGYYYFDGSKWSRLLSEETKEVVVFSTANPNSGTPTFSPNSPQNSDYIYVSNTDSSIWKWNGSAYTTFVAATSTPFALASTTTDSGSNKTSSIWRSGNVGIGTDAPAAKLEIAQGTSGNSGLRFTNLNATHTSTTSSSKVLGLNNSGDVILTNVPGTQNIVSFSTATPTTGGVVFTPNTPLDQSVIYQSATNNSLWTYNGTAYTTYTAPASTPFYLSSTTNDAGSNKTTNIYRTGGISAGSQIIYGNLTANGGTAFSGVPPYGTASIGKITQTGGWNGSGFLFSNATAGSNAFSMVYNNDKAFFGQIMAGTSNQIYGIWDSVGLSLGSSGASAINRLDVGGSAAIGLPYAGIKTGPTNGLIVSGNVGIGTFNPAIYKLDVTGVDATNTVNADAKMLQLSRNEVSGVKWSNTARFNLGSYSTASTFAFSRLDLEMNNTDASTFSNVMTWQANGNVGIGTASPLNNLDVIGGMNLRNIAGAWGSNYGIEMNTSSSSPRIDWVFNGAYIGQFSSDANDFLYKNSKHTTGGHRFFTKPDAVTAATEKLVILNNGYTGIGATSPVGRLVVNDLSYISAIPTSSSNLTDNSVFRPQTRLQVSSGANNNALSTYFTTAEVSQQSHNYSTGTVLPYSLQPAGGNVGIGITLPLNKLVVRGLNNQPSALGASQTNAILRIEGQTNHTLDFGTLETTPYGGYIQSHNKTATTVLPLLLNPNSGNVGIGMLNPLYKLDVAGDVNASGAVRANGVTLTSDSRLKSNIKAIDSGIQKVMALNPVNYDKKTSLTVSASTVNENGFIAQEIRKILPEIVTEGKDPDQLLSVNYTAIIPILTKAIQEQQITIEKQQAQIDALMKKVDQLTKKRK